MTLPVRLTVSTVCAECRADTPALTVAYQMEAEWERVPVEVDEQLCRQCRIPRHWWFFYRSA